MYDYIKINDKSYAIKFGFNCLRKFTKKTNTKLSDLDALGENMTLDTAMILIWCGLEDGARCSKEKFDFTIDDLGDALDNDMTIIDRAMKIFTEHLGGGKKDKKKATKSK